MPMEGPSRGKAWPGMDLSLERSSLHALSPGRRVSGCSARCSRACGDMKGTVLLWPPHHGPGVGLRAESSSQPELAAALPSSP